MTEERRITQQRLDKARRLIAESRIEPLPPTQMVTFKVQGDTATYLVAALPEGAVRASDPDAPPMASCTCEAFRVGGYACSHIIAAWELRRLMAEELGDPYAA